MELIQEFKVSMILGALDVHNRSLHAVLFYGVGAPTFL